MGKVRRAGWPAVWVIVVGRLVAGLARAVMHTHLPAPAQDAWDAWSVLAVLGILLMYAAHQARNRALRTAARLCPAPLPPAGRRRPRTTRELGRQLAAVAKLADLNRQRLDGHDATLDTHAGWLTHHRNRLADLTDVVLRGEMDEDPLECVTQPMGRVLPFHGRDGRAGAQAG
jgi:hypothetical protein